MNLSQSMKFLAFSKVEQFNKFNLHIANMNKSLLQVSVHAKAYQNNHVK